MSNESSKVLFPIPSLTAHIVRRISDSPGELACEISEKSDDFNRGEKGDFIVSSIPLISQDGKELEGGTITGNELFTALHLIHPDNDMGLWYVMEKLILLSFDRGHSFERSQLGREPGIRDDQKTESS